MSIIGLSMAALPCCAEEDVEAGSAALRVDWPVYPRRAEHNTVAEGGNRRWADHHPVQPDQALALLVDLVVEWHGASGRVEAIASNASVLIAMRIMGQEARPNRGAL